jgi:O-antigen/teichoic acid export membrane protein
LGVVLAAIAFLLSGFLANLYSLPEIAPLIQVSSLTILASALLTTAQAAFTGLERMELSSVVLVMQSIVKTVIVVALVAFGFGPLGAVIGFTAAMLIAGLVAILLMCSLYRALPSASKVPLEILTTIKNMLNYGLPLSIVSIIDTFQTQFYVFILPIFVAPDLIGNYGIAQTFVVLIAFFATPVSTVLFPAFSKLDPQRDHKTLQNVFQFSVKYASLLVIPATAAVMTLSQPGINVLFPKYSAAPMYLVLMCVVYLYTALGSLSVGNLLNGLGRTRFKLKLSLITFTIGFPLSIFLIMHFGILGLIVTTLTAGIPSLVIALRWINKQYSLTVDWSSSAKILLAAGIASAVTYAIISLIVNNWFALVFGTAIFLLVYLFAVTLTRAITFEDIATIRESIVALGPLERIANSFLNLIEKLTAIFQS